MAGDGVAVPGAGEGLANAGGEHGGTAVLDDHAHSGGGEDLGDSADAGGNDRGAAGEGFVDDIRPAFTAGGEAEEVGGGHGGSESVRGQDAEQVDEGGEAGVLDGPVEDWSEVGGTARAAGDPEVGGHALGVEEGEGFDEAVVAFEFGEVAGGEEVDGAGVHAEAGAGFGAGAGVESGGVDAIGDDVDAGGTGAEGDGENGEGLGDGNDAGGVLEGTGEGAAAGGVAGVVDFVATEGDGEGEAEGAGEARAAPPSGWPQWASINWKGKEAWRRRAGPRVKRLSQKGLEALTKGG